MWFDATAAAAEGLRTLGSPCTDTARGHLSSGRYTQACEVIRKQFKEQTAKAKELKHELDLLHTYQKNAEDVRLVWPVIGWLWLGWLR